MAIPTLYNLPEIDLYNVLINFITDNVQDIRPDRKNKRWVFDKFPTKNTNYPEVVIDINSSEIIEDSAAQYLGNETDLNGNITKEYYFLKERTPVRLRVLTLKDSRYTVQINGVNKYFEDKALNLYLQSKVKNIFIFNYIKLIKDYKFDNINLIERVRVTSSDKVYEANERVWASDIIVNIDFKNLYVKEYENGELINHYSLTLNIR